MKILKPILIILGLAGILLGAIANFGQRAAISCVIYGIIALLIGIVLFLLPKMRKETQRRLKRMTDKKEFILFLFLIVVFYVFWAINPNFISMNNIKGIMNSAFAMGLLAIGIGCLMISGEIDLSAGNTGMFASILMALLLRTGMAWGPALLIVLIFGVVTGLLNAFLVNVMHFMSFISTLAISTIFGGLGLIVTKAQNISIGNKSFWNLGSYMVFGSIPLPFVIMVVFFIIYGGILPYSGFGRRIYMVGNNRNAARLAGINAKKLTTILFVNGSVISCLTGIVIAARMHQGSTTSASGSEMDAITVAVLGGIAFTGGSGKMLGVAIATVLIAAFQNGLVVAGLSSYYQIVAKGILLIAALLIDYSRERSRQKSLKIH